MKKRLQGLMAGILIGSLLTGGLVFAGNYEAITASFPILVNGVEWTTDKPIVTIDGSTYLPLRALGNALGVKVEWNSELSRVEIGEAPIQSTNYSRQNPAPLNTVQQITVKDYINDYSAALRVIETIRGEQALKMIKDENMFNSDPQEGHEYILAKVAISALAVGDEKALTISSLDFKCFSANNEAYENQFIVVPKPKLADQLYAGGNTEGYVAFQVKTDDIAPKFVYGQKYDGITST